ncbi:N-acetyltransferase [Streptomyces camponoticapitis]|uniref:N-acetyltransferase n=1 Tax=Streptomyces camponoticapitis TaxID=1616125 RepID=A0ABQ2EQT7_9ACTN|nr:GNAT family N-acetyltransferase [Streptomyces camponoticapitis]GGK21304.1 N-acetyltransferase [Streptomyces camponoticapitis]
MTELGPVAWPSAPIRTERLTLRGSEARDRPAFIELFASPEVRAHLGGDAELGYMFLPDAWGRGYAAEVCAAALGWFTDALPGEPVVLCTQTANDRSMRLAAKPGFTEVERFEEYGAEQWFGARCPVTPSG